jgi:hypothetical protein
VPRSPLRTFLCRMAFEFTQHLQRRGQVAEWLKAADCKSARVTVRWFESSPVHQFIRLANWNRRDLVSYRKADPALVPSFEARLRPISDFAGANSSRCETAARISIAEQFPGYSIEVRGGNQAAIQAHRVSLESPSKSLENLGFSEFILVRDKPLKPRIWRRRRDSNPRYRIISTTV